MVGKTNVGGTKLFAAIGVTYPAGSTVTCSNGTSTLKAKTTTGKWVFAIPKAGTWTVTATQGTNSKSRSVSITTEGQFESVTLSYILELYVEGNQFTSVTGGWKLLSNGTSIDKSAFNTNYVTISPLYPNSVILTTTNQIDLTGINTLTISAQGFLAGDSNTFAGCYFGISGTQTPYTSVACVASSDWTSKIELSKTDDYITYDLDVSGITGAYYICVSTVAGNSYKGAGANVKSIIGV